MAITIGRWDLVSDSLFLFFLQLSGINSSASLLFRTYRGFTNRCNCTISQPIIRIQNFENCQKICLAPYQPTVFR
ncbi:hypothetical protein MicvaDRAFT_2807 [Microcoleus vaginatus FGP-2]|nr:hypothetical protein MicvaDRAFT_2807 [Microcoleus vaginatus FGP-2]